MVRGFRCEESTAICCNLVCAASFSPFTTGPIEHVFGFRPPPPLRARVHARSLSLFCCCAGDVEGELEESLPGSERLLGIHGEHA